MIKSCPTPQLGSTVSHLAAALWHHKKALILFFFPAWRWSSHPSPPQLATQDLGGKGWWKFLGAGPRRLTLSGSVYIWWVIWRFPCFVPLPAIPAIPIMMLHQLAPLVQLFFFFFPLVQTMQNLSVGLLLLQVGLYLAVKWIKNNFFFPRSSSVL